MPVMALLMFEGVTGGVDSQLDFQSEARPYLAGALLPLMMRERKQHFA